MESTHRENQGGSVSRRQMMKGAAAVSAAALVSQLAVPSAVHAASSDKIRIGLIGCGRRARGAAADCLNSATSIELVSMGDVFKDQLDAAFGELKNQGEKFKVTPDRCFVGFDAYQKVIDSGVDVVLLVTPPGFRPLHLKAAVEAGKHVFMEKPVAVDPVGVRSIIATSEIAAKKGLCIVAGTQRRHENQYMAVMQRIHDGQIGQITAAEAYWMGDYGYYMPVFKKPEWSDMEWQLRNWNYFAWLSGDHIVEQHVHNLDVIRWAFGVNPVKCLANGSRQVRTGPEFGHIYDNFNVSYEFPNGAVCLSMSRQMAGTANRVSEKIHGTKGQAGAGWIGGQNSWRYEGANVNPYVQEHTHLMAAIRDGKPLNEGKQVAESTMMAIMGRMSAYTGREISWSWAMNASKLDLTPAKYEYGPLPVPPVAVPGQTQLI
ncbi:MAG TPA: Gfo/Idh/MocA family oxidoreductase [Tepidisphaeraceae bacterium]|nr:Gfo/Idh/MocA family oxidoreductase [Tepidisphaeraceae bacterium]